MIKRLKFVSIPTGDQDRAVKFWTEKVGFKVAADEPGAQRWIELKIPGAETFVVLFTPEGQEDRIGTPFNGAFAADDVKKTYEQLKKRGVEFTQGPMKQPWGEYAVFKDPDGNTFVLGSK
jgi:predicted enzyme related to lactoylglutathione lyase